MLRTVGLPIGLPWLPLDEQFNETKTFGFVGDELRAGISQVTHSCDPIISVQTCCSSNSPDFMLAASTLKQRLLGNLIQENPALDLYHSNLGLACDLQINST